MFEDLEKAVRLYELALYHARQTLHTFADKNVLDADSISKSQSLGYQAINHHDIALLSKKKENSNSFMKDSSDAAG